MALLMSSSAAVQIWANTAEAMCTTVAGAVVMCPGYDTHGQNHQSVFHCARDFPRIIGRLSPPESLVKTLCSFISHKITASMNKSMDAGAGSRIKSSRSHSTNMPYTGPNITQGRCIWVIKLLVLSRLFCCVAHNP